MESSAVPETKLGVANATATSSPLAIKTVRIGGLGTRLRSGWRWNSDALSCGSTSRAMNNMITGTAFKREFESFTAFGTALRHAETRIDVEATPAGLCISASDHRLSDFEEKDILCVTLNDDAAIALFAACWRYFEMNDRDPLDVLSVVGVR